MSPEYDQKNNAKQSAGKETGAVNNGNKSAASQQKTAGDGASGQAGKYDMYVGLVRSMGKSLDESVDNVNVIGLRGWMNGKPVTNTKNKFDDTIVCVWITEDAEGNKIKHCEEFYASVDPGNKKHYHKDGMANLKTGQYHYHSGLHTTETSSYPAFRSEDTQVWRDKGNDGRKDPVDIKDDSGDLGINIHAAGDYRWPVGGVNSKGKEYAWSEGCQVIASTDGTKGANNSAFKHFRDDIIGKQDHDKKFIYTLLDGAEAKAEYDKSTVAQRRMWQNDSLGIENQEPLRMPTKKPETIATPSQSQDIHFQKKHVVTKDVRTFKKIAEQYGVSEEDLKKANKKFSDKRMLNPGDILIIPEAKS